MPVSPNKKIKVNVPKIQFAKREYHFSLRQLLVFVLIFGLVGVYFIWQSFAATSTVATVEAENMVIPAGATTVTDSTASGGKAVKLTQSGTNLTGQVGLPNNATSLTLKAKATKCRGGWPQLSLKIDGNTVLAPVAVTSGTWTTYTVNASLAATNHSLIINYSSKCSHLFVDVLNFHGEIAPPPPENPAPTVTLSASPASLSPGQSSALTWSSTNATSCTASGGWTGLKTATGQESVTPASTATYTLSCSGDGGTSSASTTVTINQSSSLNQSLGFNTLHSDVSDEFIGAAGTKPVSTRWAAKNFTSSNALVYWNGMNNVQLDGAGNVDIFAVRPTSGTYWTSTWLTGTKSYSGPHFIEARAKVPAGAGTWNSPIWEWDAPYGSNGPENDVIEQLGIEPQAYHTTIHSGGSEISKKNNTPYILANDYHTYAAAVYADRVDYYLDGTKTQTITKTEMAGKWGLVETPMVLNVSLNMGGWGGTPSSTLPSPIHMYVDYIRAYTP